jgi:hypothetical protein
VKHAQFALGGEVFMAMDSALQHRFSFNEAVSLMIRCELADRAHLSFIPRELRARTLAGGSLGFRIYTDRPMPDLRLYSLVLRS